MTATAAVVAVAAGAVAKLQCDTFETGEINAHLEIGRLAMLGT
jgi:hypothetical protein